ncbi:MAG TPA: hypothetical protein PLG67_08870 [Bacillota bacterium]|nr:hypothetical protein [Bacillota bacterium]HQE66115.1 hypothetical protein [Bacillota bacterium]HQJ37568.1 hypothetical protein [Bacillota bacterium]HQL36690.1 hypothetical protein [Bacillota bacterium]
MTIARVCENTAVREFDRGGKSMNLITELLTRLKYKYRENRDLNDYGYELYQSLEYNLKYLKGDDFGYGDPRTQSMDDLMARRIF